MDIKTYISDIEKEIEQTHKKSIGYTNTHNILTIVGIGLSASAAGILAVGASVGINLGILIASIACSVVSCITLLVDRIYDFEQLSILFNNQSKQLEKEKTYFELKTNIYKDGNEDIFVERCESILHQ